MAKVDRFILDELRLIEKECLEKGISPIEWIERHAEEYRRKWENIGMQKVGMLKNREGVRQ